MKQNIKTLSLLITLGLGFNSIQPSDMMETDLDAGNDPHPAVADQANLASEAAQHEAQDEARNNVRGALKKGRKAGLTDEETGNLVSKTWKNVKSKFSDWLDETWHELQFGRQDFDKQRKALDKARKKARKEVKNRKGGTAKDHLSRLNNIEATHKQALDELNKNIKSQVEAGKAFNKDAAVRQKTGRAMSTKIMDAHESALEKGSQVRTAIVDRARDSLNKDTPLVAFQ